jgi:hypothetical protein
VLVRHCAPYLTKYGFSWRWDFTDSKEEMRVACVLTHVNGHSEENSMSAEPDDSGGKNKIQARASANTYLERYTYIGVTGVVVEGEDNDGGKPRVTLGELLTHNEVVMRHLRSIGDVLMQLDGGNYEAAVESFYEIPDADRSHFGRARTKGGVIDDHYKKLLVSEEFRAAKVALGISDAGGETVRS